MAAHQMINSSGINSYNTDVDLHPNHIILQPGQTTISKFELDSLYDIATKVNVQKLFLESENENLRTQLQQAKSKLKDLTQGLAARDQAESLLRCQIDRLENELDSLRGLQRQSVESDTGTVAETGAETSEDVIQLVHGLNKEISAWHVKLKEAERQLVEANTVRGASAEACKKVKEMEQRLKQVENLNELLMLEKKSLQVENKKLNSKLKILADSCEDDSGLVTVKKCGRFEVQKRRLECARCHQAFCSKKEMEASPCHYHLSTPVPRESEKGKQFFWRCCSNASFRTMSKGCQKGKHFVSNKRARMEE